MYYTVSSDGFDRVRTNVWRAILFVMFYIGNITLPRNVTTLCEHVLYSKYNELRSRRVLVVINYKLRSVKVK